MTKNDTEKIDLKDNHDGTYTDPRTGKILPFDYAFPREQYDTEIKPLADALMAKCREHNLPSIFLVQTGKKETNDTILSSGHLPGPRVGVTLTILHRTFQMTNIPQMAEMVLLTISELWSLVSSADKKNKE